jgi:alpha(1,3/1,4) fucosyltransferase
MKIGIAFKATKSAFDSGHCQAVLALANRLSEQGYDVSLVNCGEWWSDIEGLKKNYRCVMGGSEIMDIMIDVDGVCPHYTAVKNILLLRSDPSFEFLEKVPYVNQTQGYALEKIHEVWVWDMMVPEERIPFLRTLFRDLPVRRVPYVWTPLLLETVVKEVRPALESVSEQTIVAFIGEKNNTNTSSCLVPFLGASKSNRVNHINLYNAIQLQTDEYFQHNIAKSASKPTSYNGRQCYTDWFNLPGLVAITHGRHVPFRPGLLDLIWLGIPFLHNSPLLRDSGFRMGYYRDSEVDEISQILDHISLSSLRKDLKGGRNWLKGSFSTGDFRPFLGDVPKQTRDVPVLRIGFLDMWEGFDATDNFFVDALRSLETGYDIQGVKDVHNIQLLIRGPFGSEWTGVDPSVPNVMFSGERVPPGIYHDERISLFLTHNPLENERQMRLPLWPLFLDWFGKLETFPTRASRNPNCLPVVGAFKSEVVNGRKDFCAFVVSNPTNIDRNMAFHALNKWRPVHSAGAFLNNIGGPIPCSYGGGGGGDQAKVAYLRDHEYCLCYENSVAPGYVTEKLLHAKLAGCIPLYRGPVEAAQDFDPEGFVQIQDGEDIVEVVKALELDPEKKRRIRATPALSPDRLKKVEMRLGLIARKLFNLMIAKPTNIVIQPPMEVACASKLTAPVFVSFATHDFVPSLHGCIQSIEKLRAAEPGIRFRAYLGRDVSGEYLTFLKREHDWVDFRHLPETSPVEGFPDFFEPSMYGWKLWILKTMCSEMALEDDLVIYTDAGTTWIFKPTDMLQVAEQNGVCLVRDRNQINRFWCSEAMCSEMAVTEEEKDANQIQAASIGFKVGSQKAMTFFDEAYTWGSKKSCLFGEKWVPGQVKGHRHDQSILSILAGRHQIPQLEGLRFSTGVSVRKAYQRSVPLYHHRGRPVNHEEVWPKIDDIWTISLDRRADRWAKLLKAHPELDGQMNRLPGIDGRELTLTENLGRLFASNDFKWKKSVTGCALSHIMLWAQLVCEHPAVNSYLILEDDVRFAHNYRDLWAKASACIPEDAELLLLGGVLPNNMPAFAFNHLPVNDTWATIKPNGLFTGGVTMPFFHFCAYSYVLTRAGARKLLDALQTKGVNTSIDNFLTHPFQNLKKYVLRNLMTTCFQADDPVYQNANFDEFLRVDEYDSDIWNNKECFAPVPVGHMPSLWDCLVDVLRTQPHSIQTINTLNEKYLVPNKNVVYYYNYKGENGKTGKGDGLMEEGWLKTLMPGIQYAPFVSAKELPLNAWLLVARPNIGFWTEVGKELETLGRPFRVIHLSDEDCLDSLTLYQNRMCQKVLRNYVRPGLNSKVSVIPLGFATSKGDTGKPYKQRTLEWSFHGSKGLSREGLLAPLKVFQPHECRFIPQFMDKSATPFQDYQALLAESKVVPVPTGMNPETFRLYEALEHGCIPLYVRCEGDTLFWNWLRTHLHLIEVKTWAQGAKVLELFRSSSEKAEQYRLGLLKEWSEWKEELRSLFA